MGYPFLGCISSTDRPAGCFWDEDRNTYFNEFVDVGLTKLDELNSVGGICRWKGKTGELCLYLYNSDWYKQ